MTDGSEFIEVIRGAVLADPTNPGLRMDLAELLLGSDPKAAAAEAEEAARLGADAPAVTLMRARVAAALLREGHAAPPIAHPVEPAAHIAPTPIDAYAAPASDEPRRVARGSGEGEAPFFDVERSRVTLADVAGMEQVKTHLEGAFLGPMRHPELAKMFGKTPGGSLLMYGPPGCGKTFLARAVAGELGAGFIHATIADLVNQWFGQTEKAIKALFAAARASAPCVIFFDEFDALAGRRSSGSSSAQTLRMMMAQLLEEMDGVGSANAGVYILAATNRPWDIDPAMRRPGRLDRTVLVLPPDAPARDAILRQGLVGRLVGAVDVPAVVQRSEDFSGADMAYVVTTAVERAFVDSMQMQQPQAITTERLLAAAADITPSTRSWFVEIAPVLQYGTDDGTFDQLRAYMRGRRL